MIRLSVPPVKSLQLEELGNFTELPVQVHVELACCPVTLNQVLSLQAGSILRTDRSAGDNVDIRVAGEHIGYGEIVVVEGVLGVRITNFKETA